MIAAREHCVAACAPDLPRRWLGVTHGGCVAPAGPRLCAGHNQGVDCWALGILVYEMLSGYSPFADHAEGNQVTIYRNIVAGRYAFPSSLLDQVAKDLVRRLLVANYTKVRRGGGGCCSAVCCV